MMRCGNCGKPSASVLLYMNFCKRCETRRQRKHEIEDAELKKMEEELKHLVDEEEKLRKLEKKLAFRLSKEEIFQLKLQANHLDSIKS